MNNNLSIKFSDKLDILEGNIVAGAYEIGTITQIITLQLIFYRKNYW